MKENRKAALGFIFVTLLIDITGIAIIIPVLPALIQELTSTGLSDAAKFGGWLLFAYAIMQFLFAPLIGSLSDKYGRKPVLIISLLGFAADYVLMALAPTMIWLFIGRIIAGICGASITTASAYIADVSTPEKRAQNFGMIGAAFGLGFIIGPVIGGLLGEYGTRIPFYAAAGLSLVNALYGMIVLPESLPKEDRRAFSWKASNPIGSLKQMKKYPVIIGLIFALFFVYVAAHAVQSTWTFYTMYAFEWSESMVGYSLGAAGLLTAIVQGGLIRVIIPKLGQAKSIYLGLAFYALGLTLFSIASQGWMMFAFLIPYCLGGIAGPALQGIMSNQVPNNEQGQLQGGLTSLMSLTSIVGPPVMTMVFALFSGKDAVYELPGAPMLLGAILCALGILFSWRTLTRNKALLVVDDPSESKAE